MNLFIVAPSPARPFGLVEKEHRARAGRVEWCSHPEEGKGLLPKKSMSPAGYG